jgi:uncharacterized protein (TIGR02271 family)
MSGQTDRNRETPGVEAPGPIDRALDRDRDDRIDVREGNKDRRVGGTSTRASGEYVEGEDREVRVPVVEEQLQVGKREVDLGEVEIRRRVVEEQQSVPVTLRHEEVQIEQVGTPTRPLRPGEDAFQEGTIRVPVRGEEAVVAKEAVVTGEVVVEKDVTTDQRQVSDTVRRTEVDFDEDYSRARTGFEQDFTTRTSAATDDWSRSRTFEHAEPNYRAGYTAGTDQRYAGREFDDIEPDLRRDYESGNWGMSGTAGTSVATGGTGMATRGTGATTSGAGRTTGGDGWERLREEVRHGFHTARNRMR